MCTRGQGAGVGSIDGRAGMQMPAQRLPELPSKPITASAGRRILTRQDIGTEPRQTPEVQGCGLKFVVGLGSGIGTVQCMTA